MTSCTCSQCSRLLQRIKTLCNKWNSNSLSAEMSPGAFGFHARSQLFQGFLFFFFLSKSRRIIPALCIANGSVMHWDHSCSANTPHLCTALTSLFCFCLSVQIFVPMWRSDRNPLIIPYRPWQRCIVWLLPSYGSKPENVPKVYVDALR